MAWLGGPATTLSSLNSQHPSFLMTSTVDRKKSSSERRNRRNNNNKHGGSVGRQSLEVGSGACHANWHPPPPASLTQLGLGSLGPRSSFIDVRGLASSDVNTRESSLHFPDQYSHNTTPVKLRTIKARKRVSLINGLTFHREVDSVTSKLMSSSIDGTSSLKRYHEIQLDDNKKVENDITKSTNVTTADNGDDHVCVCKEGEISMKASHDPHSPVKYKKKGKKIVDGSRTLDRNYFSRVKGSDPRAATCRGKLQSKRSKLNMEINKELMLRSGAENLYKATTNKKIKDTVALELSYVNSNLQLLKEQLAELNSSVELYQKKRSDKSKKDSREMPMVPLGLKETKEIDFFPPLTKFIETHYHESAHDLENCIAEFMDIRQAMRTPTRDLNGTNLLFEYFNQLYHIEKRFFAPDKTLSLFFEWYDSLTGVPTNQRTIAFEKACVLFNIGALYTQIATKQDQDEQNGLDNSVDNFLRSAGTFKYILDNFANAPSVDLSPDSLDMLVRLMCAQARECLFDKSRLKLESCLTSNSRSESTNSSGSESENEIGDKIYEDGVMLAQEAAFVSDIYGQLHTFMESSSIKSSIPSSWSSMANVKQEHYKALSHYLLALVLLNYPSDTSFSNKLYEMLQFATDGDDDVPDTGKDSKKDGGGSKEKKLRNGGAAKINNMRKGRGVSPLKADARMYKENRSSIGGIDSVVVPSEIGVPQTRDQRRYIGKAHLKEALILHEESMRLNRMCRELSKKDVLQLVLKHTHDLSLDAYTSVDDEDDFKEVIEPPTIVPATQFQISVTHPDLTIHRVDDLFSELGPISVFNSKMNFNEPRTVKLVHRKHQHRRRNKSNGNIIDEDFGFSTQNDAPVAIGRVNPRSIAEAAGVREGDVILAVNDECVKWMTREEVMNRIWPSNLNNESRHTVVVRIKLCSIKQITPDTSNNNNAISSEHSSTHSSNCNDLHSHQISSSPKSSSSSQKTHQHKNIQYSNNNESNGIDNKFDKRQFCSISNNNSSRRSTGSSSGIHSNSSISPTASLSSSPSSPVSPMSPSSVADTSHMTFSPPSNGQQKSINKKRGGGNHRASKSSNVFYNNRSRSECDDQFFINSQASKSGNSITDLRSSQNSKKSNNSHHSSIWGSFFGGGSGSSSSSKFKNSYN